MYVLQFFTWHVSSWFSLWNWFFQRQELQLWVPKMTHSLLWGDIVLRTKIRLHQRVREHILPSTILCLYWTRGLWMKEIGSPMRWSTQIAWVVDCFCPIEVPHLTSGTSIQRCRKMNAWSLAASWPERSGEPFYVLTLVFFKSFFYLEKYSIFWCLFFFHY